jgi:uncharacterized phage protein gp47/JayE
MKPIPSIQAIYNKLANDLKTKLGLSDNDLKFVIDAMSGVLAAQFKIVYLYLSDIQNNIFPDTADVAANGGTLERMGLIYLNRLPFPATNGIYAVTVTGVTGAVLRAGLTFKSGDNSTSPGNLYVLDNEYTLTGVTDIISLRSLDPGLDFILKLGDQLSPTEPVLGLDQTAVVTAITESPVEAEDIEIYRQAIIDAIQLEPQGGAKTDYRIWSSDAQGVRKVYPYVKQGEAGTVQVFIEATTVDSTDGHGTPTTSLMDDVRAVIEFDPDTTIPTNDRGRRPIQANVEVLPISSRPVDVNISGLQNNTAEIRASIQSSLIDYLYTIRPYIAGADLSRDKNDVLTSSKLISVIIDTIGNDNSFTEISLFVDGVQVITNTFSLSNIPYLRNVTYN